MTLTKIAAGSASFSATFSITVPAGGVAFGHGVLMFIWGFGAAVTSATASDSRGNTYQQDATINNAQGLILVLSGYVGIALQSGDSVSVTLNDSTVIIGAIAYDLSTLAASSWKDQSASQLNGFGTTQSTGTTGVTTQAEEAIFALFQGNTGLSSYGSGFTGLDDALTPSAGIHGISEWKGVSSMGTQSGSITLSGNDTANGLIVTYKAGTSGRLCRATDLSGLGGAGQQKFNPGLEGT